MVLSSAQLTMNLPPGCTNTPRTQLSCPTWRNNTDYPPLPSLVSSNTEIVIETFIFHTITLHTRVIRQMPMLTSHILIVLSLDPDRRKGPGFPLFLLCKTEIQGTCKLTIWKTTMQSAIKRNFLSSGKWHSHRPLKSLLAINKDADM